MGKGEGEQQQRRPQPDGDVAPHIAHEILAFIHEELDDDMLDEQADE